MTNLHFFPNISLRLPWFKQFKSQAFNFSSLSSRQFIHIREFYGHREQHLHHYRDVTQLRHDSPHRLGGRRRASYELIPITATACNKPLYRRKQPHLGRLEKDAQKVPQEKSEEERGQKTGRAAETEENRDQRKPDEGESVFLAGIEPETGRRRRRRIRRQRKSHQKIGETEEIR